MVVKCEVCWPKDGGSDTAKSISVAARHGNVLRKEMTAGVIVRKNGEASGRKRRATA